VKPEQRRILIVDDEPDLCEILRFAFEDHGYLVETAGTGSAAARLVAARAFDAVLTDIRMPGGDGLSLIEHIASMNGRRPAVFVMTGFRDIGSETVAALGVANILQKPFSMEEVLSAVTKGVAYHEVL
jgi:CheY-like chemotaxis protein